VTISNRNQEFVRKRRLDLNDERRNDRFIQKSRRFWVKGVSHPPHEDPCLTI
jgi:hypothetical protein